MKSSGLGSGSSSSSGLGSAGSSRLLGSGSSSAGLLGSGGSLSSVTSSILSPQKMETAYDVLTFLPEHPDARELFATRCNTVEDKYRLLEARDKLLRARIPKVKVRVEFATRLYGTCLDMCPEKERYMRQYQRQLTSFEIDEDSSEIVVDHRRAIKAYSRSSADQDEPLPHDLRPGSTLEMTLNYLLHHIVPLAELNEDVLGDWYNFLWDRTRSIRKDITQQQLTDLCVVSLMEKCTRLHIHCSSRLCELEVHLFDPKLNDENLMKCLQSLEHLYDDLRRRDVRCPNEPEFRAYQIMMNLNEGDILLSVQQRPEWILKSPDVQAAIKLHHYIFSKNFVGFFRLVKSFSYMFSCIAHRYFYQVRYRALISICRSSSGKKGDVPLVLSQVQRMLGFGEDPSLEFQNFCEIHGLLVDVENDRILYNRRRFVRPDSTVINREYYLIEAKLTTTTAEAINGGPLPENPLFTYQPHNSFDAEGFLKPGPVAGERSAHDTVNFFPNPEPSFEMENTIPEENNEFAAAALQKSKMPSFMAKSKQSSIFKSALDGLGKFSKSTYARKKPLFGGSSAGFENLSMPVPLPPLIPTVASSTIRESPPLFGGSSAGFENLKMPVPLPPPPSTTVATSSTFGGGSQSVFGGSSSSFGNLGMPETLQPPPVNSRASPTFGGSQSLFGGSSSGFENLAMPETLQPPPVNPRASPTFRGSQSLFGGSSSSFGNLAMPEPLPPAPVTTTASSTFGGSQSLFGGSSSGFGNLSMPVPAAPTFVSTSFMSLNLPPATKAGPTIFASQSCPDWNVLEREATARKMQVIDTTCSLVLEKMLHKFMRQELQESAKKAIDQNIEERALQAKLRKKEEIRSRLTEEAVEKILGRAVPFCVQTIVHEEVQRHRWIQSVCELYATKAIDSMVTMMVEPICAFEVSHQRAHYERTIRRASSTFRRLKLKFILHKWLAFAKAKQLARKLKEEQLLQDMLNFPAANPVGQSPKERLQHLRGNGISPNIIKTNMSTKTWLDKCERAESLAENFRSLVSTFVIQHNKSSSPSGINHEIQEPKRNANEEYKRHCWKRRWTNTFTDPLSPNHEFDGTRFEGRRKSKSPRQEFTNNYHTSPRHGQSVEETRPQNYQKSEADALLEEIRKFAEEAKREKLNFLQSEEAIAGQLNKDCSSPHMNGNSAQ